MAARQLYPAASHPNPLRPPMLAAVVPAGIFLHHLSHDRSIGGCICHDRKGSQRGKLPTGQSSKDLEASKLVRWVCWLCTCFCHEALCSLCPGMLQEDIRSLLPEALELIRNKLDVLRASHLDGFERTQLDALQLDVCILYHPAAN